MQDATQCESIVLRHLAHDQHSMTSNGKLHEVLPVVSKSDDIVGSRDEPLLTDERLKGNSIITTNDISTSLGTSSANQPLLWPISSPAVTSATDENFIHGLNSVNNGDLTLQQYQSSMNAPRSIYHSNAALPPNPVVNSISQQGRRAITGHNTISNFPRQPANYMMNAPNNPKMLPQWGNSQLMPWAGHQAQPPMYSQRRPSPSPNAMAQGLIKKQAIQQQIQQQQQHHQQQQQQQSYISPTKFKRPTGGPGHISAPTVAKSPYDFSALEEAIKLQNQPSYDIGKFSSVESHFLDLKKSQVDSSLDLAGKLPYMIEDPPLVDDGSLDQTVPNLGPSPRSSPTSQGIDRIERFSRKVFVGGLPPDIDEEEITTAFRRFGALVVDWPHKAESKSYFPPKGYCFLIFQDELSVQSLIESCLMDEDKLYWCVSSPTMKDKPVQIRPWSLSDSDFVMDGSQPLDPRKTIFVGGVPRPLRAVELAMIMDRLYGGVCYAGIDTDPELKYPKGAGRVAFSNQQSYIAAISARFVQLQYGDIDKRVEVKPYVLDDQMCDECHGTRCAGKFAPFFCANVTCLQYYCEFCWAQIHSRPGREYHKPLVKEGADRPRAVPFRWC